MRWQKPARIAIAVIGLGTAVAVYTLTKKRPVIVNTPLAVAADPTATLQSEAGEQMRTDGSKVTGKITYQRLRQYDDGRTVYDKARFELANGSVLSAEVVEMRATGDQSDKGIEATLTGAARMEMSDGTKLEGAKATYSGATGMATIPGATTFTRGSMTGTGNGGTWERDSGTIKLLADANVTMTPSAVAGAAPSSPVKASAQTMTFVRDGNAMLFEQNARIAREAETLSADRATIYLSDGQDGFRSIELRTNSVVAPAPGKTSDMPEMRAVDIDLGFYEGSQALQRAVLHQKASVVLVDADGRRTINGQEINFGTAPDGKTMTRLEANGSVSVVTPASKDAAARTITAASLLSQGSEKTGLQAAIFEGGARFEESVPASGGQAATKRIGTAQTLRLRIDGQLDAITDATFERNAKFTSGDISGEGGLGVYKAKEGKLDLYPSLRSPIQPPHVSDGNVDINAAEVISVDLDTSDVYARKEVKTVTQGDSKAGAASSSAMFSPAKPIYGFGSEFNYTAKDGTGLYKGPAARLSQPEENGPGSEVIGDEVRFVRERQDLRAIGHVESTFNMTTAPPPGSAKSRASASRESSRRVKADRLDYVEAERTASYTGNPAVLTGDDGQTSAKKLVMTLAKDSREMQRLFAEGDVYSTFSAGREARGATLLYEAASDTYTLQGGPPTPWPLTLLTRESDGTCSRQDGNFVRFAGETGAPDFPRDRNPGGAPLTTKLVCPPGLAGKK